MFLKYCKVRKELGIPLDIEILNCKAYDKDNNKNLKNKSCNLINVKTTLQETEKNDDVRRKPLREVRMLKTPLSSDFSSKKQKTESSISSLSLTDSGNLPFMKISMYLYNYMRDKISLYKKSCKDLKKQNEDIVIELNAAQKLNEDFPHKMKMVTLKYEVKIKNLEEEMKLVTSKYLGQCEIMENHSKQS